MKKQKISNEEKLLNLLLSLHKNIQEQTSINSYQNLLHLLETAIKRVKNKKQTPELEARAVYQNICTTCLVDKITLSDNENSILKKIDNLSHSKGLWGEMNTLTVANQWLGK